MPAAMLRIKGDHKKKDHDCNSQHLRPLRGRGKGFLVLIGEDFFEVQ